MGKLLKKATLSFEDIQIASGYIQRPDGSWIISSIASPADIHYHMAWLAKREVERKKGA